MIKNKKDLDAIIEKLGDSVLKRKAAEVSDKKSVLVCGETGCISSGCQKVFEAFKKEISEIKQRAELEKHLNDSTISDPAKDHVRGEWEKIHDSSGFASTPEHMTGTLNKTGFTPYVMAQASSFIYTWMINPNPQTKTLATVMCGFAGLGYLGQSAVKGVKEVQVEKANANTEVDLQDRLVQVELKNFYAKKRSFIAPIMEDTKEKIRLTDSKEEIKKHKEEVLAEIKNGPPFVYS